MIVRSKFFIDGAWADASDPRTIDVFDPTTETVMGQVAAGGATDIDAAVHAAHRALPAWSALPAARRADYLGAIADAIERRGPEIASLITSEVGVPIGLSEQVQVGASVMYFRDSESALREFVFETQYGSALVRKEPVGVVGAITPWNYPLMQTAAKVAPALATGCAVVLKPSEVAPLNIFILAEILQEVGLPPGVVNIVCGTGKDAGEPLARHPLVNMMSFTGSTVAGTRVAELAVGDVKRVTLEMGGKSPSVVLPDADLQQAVNATVADCFSNSGQKCCAHTRLIVPRDRLAEAEEIAVDAAESFTVGNPHDRDNRIGPLVSLVQRERVQKLISTGMEEGARLLTGGTGAPEGLDTGYFVRPTVFSGVGRQMEIAQKEVFGPVLAILDYEDVTDAIDVANDSEYGLGGAVWAGPADEAFSVARRIRTGQVSINGGVQTTDLPFGGFKKSGFGREGGVYAFDEFLELKAIF